MTISHIFIGGIGTIVETSQMQLDAFNKAFEKTDIDFTWSHDDYKQSLSSSGGKNRLSKITLNDGSKLGAEQIVKIHNEKTQIYKTMMREEGLALRDGAAAMFEHARGNNIAVIWATTTSQDNIDAIIDASGGTLSKDMFAYISNDKTVEAAKPDPEIYLTLLEDHNIEPLNVLVIEDSPTGVASAKAANLYTVAYPGEMHELDNFDHADAIINSLKDVTTIDLT